MRYFARSLVALLLVLASTAALGAAAQQRPDPDSPRFKGVQALQELLGTTGDEALQTFLDEKIAPNYREKVGDDSLLAMLGELRQQFDGMMPAELRPQGPLSASMFFQTGGVRQQLDFTLSEDDPSRFASITTSESDEN